MKIRIALLLAAMVLAICAGNPAAQASSHGGLDQSFGRSGIARVILPATEERLEGFTIGADGRTYVLYGSLLLALEGNGEVADEFGEDGLVSVAPDIGSTVSGVPVLLNEEGEGGPAGLAVDSQGRLVVVGSTYLGTKQSFEAYVIRLEPDGIRDPGFGDDGEVDTDFDLSGAAGHAQPSVRTTSIVVDRHDRPVIGGSVGDASRSCGVDPGTGPTPFLGRLTVDGLVDRAFAHSGHAVIRLRGKVFSISRTRAGGTAVFSRSCPEGARIETQSPRLSTFTEGGRPSSLAAQRELPFSYVASAVDSRGRILEVESPPEVVEGASALTRLLPNGDRDRSFGRDGKVFLRNFSPLAVDARDRIVLAAGDAGRIVLRRFLPNGKADMGFGPGGRLAAKGRGTEAIAFDADGRIYTLALAQGPSRTTLQVARFVPGD